MIISQKQLEFIKKDLSARGVALDDLAESLLDHICCCIEAESTDDFQEAYHRALESFGENGLINIQKETIYLLTLKQFLIMIKLKYILGFLTVFLITAGGLFKMMHWPFASILLVFGFGIFLFGLLPILFYSKYKEAIS